MLAALPAVAQDKRFTLNAAPELVASGLTQHLIPRFSFKTQVRITLTDGDADLTLSGTGKGRAVFSGMGKTWRMSNPQSEHAKRFADWLTSEVGRNTIASFAPEGTKLFSPDVETAVIEETIAYDGDAAEGARLSELHCARCHVVHPERRLKSIGSTPSFMLMRTFDDWDSRFAAFFALKPHPAFTQVEGITEPFPVHRPPPIVPLEMTLDDIDAILAYVQLLEPADLGAPLQID
ncbi:hypothetical protein PGB28_05405 [Primorskyibacter aestuariivivens]|uniref:hypothetical protein n=1 Tax=Primorskyibacter aestuariivivens TaxID=1888912 RepID=UPI002301ECF5|nr:hypothetical protein [Primorskyibacter aestuariivivens]MDA7427887.1 hypothetical protein [Primorskyibacter aestuariivivens]